MLFAAGMGSGLVFWGVAEPLIHLKAAVNPEHSPQFALALAHFHWGLHAWAIYAVSGLSIAWFAYVYQRPMTISASFSSSLEGQKKFFIFDYLAVLAIIFGVAGTFANSIALIETGVQKIKLYDAGGFGLRMTVLALISFCFIISSSTGLKRGIKYLSNFNIVLAMLILLSVILLSNPFAIASEMVLSTAIYLRELPRLSFFIPEATAKWSQSWSIINLVWWIAWAPFVGLFIAKISRGRSIREFLLTVILVPTLASILWFSAFAGSAFHLPGLEKIVASMNSTELNAYTNGLFVFFEQLPFGKILAGSAILLLLTFVITSADSAIYVTGLLTNSPGILSKLLWSSILIALTIALLQQNNIELNRLIAISGAAPFTLILIAQIVMLLKDLMQNGLGNLKQR